MKSSRILIAMFLSTLAAGISVAADSPDRSPGARTVPADWLSAWRQPPPADRPMQIVHEIHLHKGMPEGLEQMVPGGDAKRVNAEWMKFYKDRGLGGVVCNVSFRNYLDSEEDWKNLVACVDAMAKLGMVVWIYDEKGYPSGAAGGHVLRENRGLEALELAKDADRSDPFLIRGAYEFTHASNNYHAARRYINLLDQRATETFIAKTHEAYFQRLKPHFGHTVQAMFTDEPSLIALSLGQLPEKVRGKVPVVDPLDPAARPLPAVPWVGDLPQRYRERFGEDLLPGRASLFAGQAPEDRKTRRQFWSLVADLVADRYFGALQRWCGRHGIASSGHSLWEESLLHHVPLEGNGLKVLGRMDIPGLDLLTSNPDAVLGSGWMTAGMPTSAAVLHGRRRVMTEVSDFSENMSGRGPAALADMQATAAWQAAWGVTEFTLYYRLAERSADQYRAYCEYVGRLNAILKPARLESKVLLYYPIHDLWAEYLPVAEPLRLHSQSARAQRIVSSFMRLGQSLQRSQIPLILIDHESLAAAATSPEGKLTIAGHAFDAIVVPEDVELESKAAVVVERFRKQGGRVLAGPWAPQGTLGSSLIKHLQPPERITPACPAIALGRFSRDGRPILLAVNVGRTAYEGELTVGTPGAWQVLDPASGAIQPAQSNGAGRLRLSLAPRQAVLLVQ